MFSNESNTLEITRTLKRLFLDLDSIATESALKNPAIGALILSFKEKFLRSMHNSALYAALKRHVNPPNLAESLKSYEENLNTH